MSDAAPPPKPRRMAWRMCGWAKMELLLDGKHERFVWLAHGEHAPAPTAECSHGPGGAL